MTNLLSCFLLLALMLNFIASSPVSDPGLDQTIIANNYITLSGSNSYNLASDNIIVDYEWTVPQEILDANPGLYLYGETLTFIAPDVSNLTTYSIYLTVTDEYGMTSSEYDAQTLIISEYSEANNSSNNRYIEIYNGTGQTITSAEWQDYEVWLSKRGANYEDPDQEFYDKAIFWRDPIGEDIDHGLDEDEVWRFNPPDLEHGETLLLIKSAVATTSEQDIREHAHIEWPALVSMSGDDGIGLIKNGVPVDVVGGGYDPGSAWTVAGESYGTRNSQLVRKPSIATGNYRDGINFWDESAGTDADDSEWIVLDPVCSNSSFYNEFFCESRTETWNPFSETCSNPSITLESDCINSTVQECHRRASEFLTESECENEGFDWDDAKWLDDDFSNAGFHECTACDNVVNISVYPFIEGCTDQEACNFDPYASVEDGSCYYAEFPYNCDGSCLTTEDCFGVCWDDPVGDLFQDGCDLPDNNLYITSQGAVLYNSSESITSFQFTVEGGTILSVDGGDAASSGLLIGFDNSTVFGSSAFNETDIPSGCGTLTQLTFDGSLDRVISMFISTGGELDIEYYMASEDCLGDCAGNALIDECGICDGPGEIYECCDGSLVCGAWECSEPSRSTQVTVTDVTLLSENLYSIELSYQSSVPIGGFQIAMISEGVLSLSNPSGGAAQLAGFDMSHGNGITLGYSLTGERMPATNNWTPMFNYEATINEGFSIDENILLNSSHYPDSGFTFIIANSEGENLSANFIPVYLDLSTGNLLGYGDGCEGCANPGACNYDPHAIFDDGSCEFLDCFGDCGGTAIIDQCDVCGGDNSSCCTSGIFDCAGICCGGDTGIICAEFDNCGVCNGSDADDLGCGCFEPGPSGCDNVCGSDLEFDECGVCDGDDSSCADCAGTPNGVAVEDMCGTCDSDSSNDCVQDCAGIWGGTAIEMLYYFDSDGDGLGSGLGVLFCDAFVTEAWVDNASDAEPDCATNDTDACGLCAGDNSSCTGCTDEAAENYDYEATIPCDNCCNYPATILEIIDVPNDQGGRVYINFSSSAFDTDSLLGRNEIYSIERFDEAGWVTIISGPAYGQDQYLFEATTLQNQTDLNEGISTFRIIAAMDEGNWVSEESSGFSIDNLDPNAPTGLFGRYQDNSIYLSWDDSIDSDILYYEVYKDQTLIGTSYSNSFVDDTSELAPPIYYHLLAFDQNHNVSESSETLMYTSEISGDVTQNFELNILDVIVIVSIVIDEYYGGLEPPQYILDQSDANNDGLVDIFDIVILITQIMDI